MGRRILVTWIGHTDLKAMAVTLSATQRKAIAEVVRGELDEDPGVGPVKALLDKEKFQQIHLLSNYVPKVAKQYASWIKRRAVTHNLTLQNPSDHGQILAVVPSVIGFH